MSAREVLIDEDHYVVMVAYGGGRHTLTRQQVGTRYVFAAVRILVDPNDPQDVEAVHALQDALTASQPASGSFEVPGGTRPARSRSATRCCRSARRSLICEGAGGAGRRWIQSGT